MHSGILVEKPYKCCPTLSLPSTHLHSVGVFHIWGQQARLSQLYPSQLHTQLNNITTQLQPRYPVSTSSLPHLWRCPPVLEVSPAFSPCRAGISFPADSRLWLLSLRDYNKLLLPQYCFWSGTCCNHLRGSSIALGYQGSRGAQLHHRQAKPHPGSVFVSFLPGAVPDRL